MLVCNLAGGAGHRRRRAQHASVPGFDMVLLPGGRRGHAPRGRPPPVVFAMRRTRYPLTTMYWNQPDKWAARWRGDFWITGDLARRDANGRYWFVGREDDLIITSGYNVGPTEVEAVLLADPTTSARSPSWPPPDDARGSVVRAVVVPAAGVRPPRRSPGGSRTRVRVAVGRHAYPRIVDYVDAAPPHRDRQGQEGRPPPASRVSRGPQSKFTELTTPSLKAT